MIEIGKWDDDNPSCPKCGNVALEYEAYEPIDEFFKQDVSCPNCDSNFMIYAPKPRYWEIWAYEGFHHIEVKNEH